MKRFKTKSSDYGLYFDLFYPFGQGQPSWTKQVLRRLLPTEKKNICVWNYVVGDTIWLREGQTNPQTCIQWYRKKWVTCRINKINQAFFFMQAITPSECTILHAKSGRCLQLSRASIAYHAVPCEHALLCCLDVKQSAMEEKKCVSTNSDICIKVVLNMGILSWNNVTGNKFHATATDQNIVHEKNAFCTKHH